MKTLTGLVIPPEEQWYVFLSCLPYRRQLRVTAMLRRLRDAGEI